MHGVDGGHGGEDQGRGFEDGEIAAEGGISYCFFRDGIWH